jgi:hypothetical protein
MRDHLPTRRGSPSRTTRSTRTPSSTSSCGSAISATVVFKIAVKDGKVTSVLKEVYHGEACQEEPDSQRWLVKPEGQERNGGNGNGGAEEKKQAVQAPAPAPTTAVEEAKEKKRKGRAPTEGEPLKRVLIFLSDDDITRLKSEVGERGMSTKVREIIKAYLAPRA